MAGGRGVEEEGGGRIPTKSMIYEQLHRSRVFRLRLNYGGHMSCVFFCRQIKFPGAVHCAAACPAKFKRRWKPAPVFMSLSSIIPNAAALFSVFVGTSPCVCPGLNFKSAEHARACFLRKRYGNKTCNLYVFPGF